MSRDAAPAGGVTNYPPDPAGVYVNEVISGWAYFTTLRPNESNKTDRCGN